jgi:hypothetical protein
MEITETDWGEWQKALDLVDDEEQDWMEIVDPYALQLDGSTTVLHKTRGGLGEVGQLRRKPAKRKSTRRGRRRP